jgi:DDE superfamily endonuclease
MTICFLNNVYILFLPAHTSHVTQPLDLGCFSSFKTEYRRLVGDLMAETDISRVGKAKFLEFYGQARLVGLRSSNICSGWKSTGLYPLSRRKPLSNPWVITKRAVTPSPPPETSITTPTNSNSVHTLFNAPSRTPNTRLMVRKFAVTLDKRNFELALAEREIASLKEQLELVRPVKRRKVRQDPNERFVTLAGIASQRTPVPVERSEATPSAQATIVVGESDSESEAENEIAVRRSERQRRPVRYRDHSPSDSD